MTEPQRHRLNRSLPLRNALLLALLLQSISGCSLFGGKTADVRSIELVADGTANEFSATAIDIVFVYQTSAASLLPTDGPAWFARRDSLRNTLASQADIVSLQVPPPYASFSVSLPKRYKDAVRVVAFANFLTVAGQAPIDLSGYKHAVLRLRTDRIDIGNR